MRCYLQQQHEVGILFIVSFRRRDGGLSPRSIVGEGCRNGLSPRFSEPSRAKHNVTPIRFSAAAWPTRFLEHHSSSSHSSPSFTTLLGLPLRALMVLPDGVSSSDEVSSALAAVIIFIIELSIYMVSLSVFCVNHALQSLIINALSHIHTHTHKIDKPPYAA